MISLDLQSAGSLGAACDSPCHAGNLKAVKHDRTQLGRKCKQSIVIEISKLPNWFAAKRPAFVVSIYPAWFIDKRAGAKPFSETMTIVYRI